MEKIAKEIANFYAYQIKGLNCLVTNSQRLAELQAAVYRIYQESPVQAS